MRINWIAAVAIAASPFAGGILSGTQAAAQSRQPSRTENRYADMDRDRDGVITRSEWRGTRQAFDAADWNRDGVLSGNEVRLDARDGQNARDTASLRAEFRRLDRNNDAIVTPSEWKGNRREFTDSDLNHDGFLTEREYAGLENAPRSSTNVRNVDVDPRVRWVDTGLIVDTGDILTFNTDGSVQLSDDAGDTASAAGAPSGRRAPDAPMPRELAGALIAHIGNATAFGVGDQRQIVAPASGRLFLGVNDDHLADNRGRFRVRVEARAR